jgi:hypothetical protein
MNSQCPKQADCVNQLQPLVPHASHPRAYRISLLKFDRVHPGLVEHRPCQVIGREAYRRKGFAVQENGGGGADGGIDLILRRGGETWLVQGRRPGWGIAETRQSQHSLDGASRNT